MFRKIFDEWKLAAIFLFLVLLVALFLRTCNINELPIFGDEAIYIRWAQIMRNEPTLRFIPLTDGKQPLFMWVVIPFQKVFSDPLIAGRMVSVAAGLVNTVGVFVLSYLLFKNKKVSLITSLIYAISPFTVFFDRMALADSMLTMFGIWTLTFSILAVRYVRLDFAMIAGFALGGAMLTKSPALFFLILLPTSLLLANWPKRSNAKLIHLIKLAPLWLVTSVIGIGMYNIQRLGPNFHMLTLRTKDYVYPANHFFSSPLDPFLPFAHRILQYFWIMGPGLIIVFFILGLVLNFMKYKKELLLLIAWILPIFAVAEFSKTMTARYVLFTTPYVIIVAATIMLTKNELYKKVFVFGFLLFILFAVQYNLLLLTDIHAAKLPRSERSGYLEEWTSGTGIREVSEYIREYHLENPDEKIVVGTEGFFGPLPDGLQAYLADQPEITVIGVGTELVSVPDSLIASRDFGNKTFLVINDSRLDVDPETIGLELLAAYPKALRPEFVPEYKHLGPQEVLYLFEVN
jgi:4-amino-4-deoxy-L-arabinose transferase-like glycosyltransferase